MVWRMRLADPHQRLRSAFLVVCIVASLFAGRLVQLQGLNSSGYAAAATSERLRTIVEPAVRGDILDASGRPLAATINSVTLVADQMEILNPAAAALTLSPILGTDAARLQARLTGQDRYVIVQRDVSAADWRAIRAIDLPGLFAEPAPERVYPNGPVAGNVVGFLEGGGGGDPLAGLEASYNQTLAGKAGSVTYEKAVGAGRIPHGESSHVPPVPGRSLQLTLDRDVQWYAQRLLADKVAQVEADSAVAVVFEVRTGRILAMAQAPSVDPSRPGLLPKDQRGAHPVEVSYEPGSVQKPITVAALLDAGLVDAQTVLTVPDSIKRSGKVIHDFSAHEPREMTIAGVVARSSNVGTLLAAERMEPARMRDYLERFGFGQRPQLGLFGESAGIIPARWSQLDQDVISFGQTMSASIVQMASAYQALANAGTRVPLRLVDAVIDADGTRHPLPQATPEQVVSPEAARSVTSMLEAVMQPGGTASQLVIPGYRLAGKTGTAQKSDPACRCYRGFTASFMGYAPADTPEIGVAVSVQNPRKSRYGGSTAGPVWVDLMGFTLQKLGVAPSGALAPKVRLYADED